MEKFKAIEKIAEGTFGIVYKALENDELVAIKEMKLKYTNWEECKSLREVKSLINLKHENIVKLKEVNLEKEKLFLVFEFMDKNLYDLMMVLNKRNKKLHESQIKFIIYQTLNGIAYMHRYGFFHRDMKPENLLVKGESVKIADFGLAREIRSLPPYTDYVSTRWYRAPECLLKASNYNSPIDIWAIGAIMTELYTLKPLFPGTSEKDQLFKICSIIGSPVNQWSEAINLAKKIEFKFPNVSGLGLKSSIPEASTEAIELISEMLRWDPNKRPTASKLLSFPFFSKINLNTKISMILNDDREASININNNNYDISSKTIIKQVEESEIDKMIEEIKNEDLSKKSPKQTIPLINNNNLKFDSFDDLISKKEQVSNAPAFNFSQVPKQLYYTNLKKTNKFDSNSLNGVSEQNFPSKLKKFHEFDHEFLINSKTNNSTALLNFSKNLSSTVGKAEKIREIPIGLTTLDEKENSPNKNEKAICSEKNRLKLALKFIEESFDVNKNNELILNNKIESIIGLSNTISKDRNLSKRDSTLKFIEENLINQDKTKSPKESSPQRILYSNSALPKKVENSQEFEEYEFESRRKKR